MRARVREPEVKAVQVLRENVEAGHLEEVGLVMREAFEIVVNGKTGATVMERHGETRFQEVADPWGGDWGLAISVEPGNYQAWAQPGWWLVLVGGRVRAMTPEDFEEVYDPIEE